MEKEYNELKNKYNLPEFSKVDFEFEISSSEETTFILRHIIRKICERLDFYTSMLEELLQPDASNIYSMHETKEFNDIERQNMYNLYKKLMKLNRLSIEIALLRQEDKEADFISNFFTEWDGIKTKLLEIVKKSKDSWDKEAQVEQEVEYMG